MDEYTYSDNRSAERDRTHFTGYGCTIPEFKHPLIIMSTIPLAFTGSFLLLFVTGTDLGILPIIGLLVLVGIVVNNGIVLSTMSTI
jgi:multidrug efflux pump subunit AcrB